MLKLNLSDDEKKGAALKIMIMTLDTVESAFRFKTSSTGFSFVRKHIYVLAPP